MSPKPDVSAERKQQIYQAALACFNRKGYYQTTMDDIVVESGLSKGALYWYFDSKKALFIALLEDFMAPMGQEWETIAADQSLTAVEKLRQTMGLFGAQFDAMVDFFGLVIEAWAQTHFDDDVQQLTREMYEPYLALMIRILEEGVARGEFQAANVVATSAIIMTLYDGLTLTVGAGMIDQDPKALLAAAEALVLSGLGAEV
ncbi:MAG: TetR/AcrR family transcriptional regulator [Chloroflexota bacterium]|jgi:AcrR family transcriptional regulator